MMLSRGTKVYLGEKELKHCFKIDIDIINNEIEIQAYVEDIRNIEVDRHDRITVDIHGQEFYFTVEEARVHIEPEEVIMIHIKGFKLMV